MPKIIELLDDDFDDIEWTRDDYESGVACDEFMHRMMGE